jgi:hypothetical protein
VGITATRLARPYQQVDARLVGRSRLRERDAACARHIRQGFQFDNAASLVAPRDIRRIRTIRVVCTRTLGFLQSRHLVIREWATLPHLASVTIPARHCLTIETAGGPAPDGRRTHFSID